MNIKSVKVATASLVSIGMLFGAATPSIAADQAPSQSASQSSDHQGSDEGMLEFADALDKLPEDLKTADPAKTPNYEQRITDELAKQGIALKTGNSANGVTTYASVGDCITAAVPFAVSLGVPAFKIVKVIRTAYKEWGSISVAAKAIQRGEGLSALGEEGVNILSELTGVGSVYNACIA